MKMIKMALLGGAAMAVTAASAQADDLEALKAQIDALNTRVAAMETAPSVPTGYQLIAVSEGDLEATPGLGFTARERAGYGNKGTVISVLPTADAPAGTTITWSGYARAGLVYGNESIDRTEKKYGWDTNGTAQPTTDDFWNDALVNDAAPVNTDDDDIDVKARGQIRVKASTDTAVGEVGVDIRLRANFNGNGAGDVYSDVAWGYWAMTPELTFGGGYAGSLGNIGYGYDGACTCYYTDNADLGFDPGDVTQMRLSYGSGPFSMAIALEDAGTHPWGIRGDDDTKNGDQLGAAGEVKYSGDVFSGEIAGVWRNNADIESTVYEKLEGEADANWQVGIGLGFGLGDLANFSIAAAMGEGTSDAVTDGVISAVLPSQAQFWGVTALASFQLADEFHAELGAGYKNREGDGASILDEVAAGAGDDIKYSTDGFDYDTYGILGGIYYSPVDQLTIGVEAEWYTSEGEVEVIKTVGGVNSEKTVIDREKENFSVDLVSVWRF